MKFSNGMSKGRSCDACYQRKIHCDLTSASSQCDWCKHQGLLCTFNRPFGRRKRNRQITPISRAQQNPGATVHYGTVTTPWTRVQSLSKTSSPPRNLPSLDSAGLAINGPPVRDVKALPYAGLGGFYFNGVHLGGISSKQGIPFFSKDGEDWICAYAGSTPTFQKSCATDAPIRIKGTWELPDRETVYTYLSVFNASNTKLVFPIIDEASFMDIIDKAYDNGRDQTSPNVICAKACVLSFTCVMVHMAGGLDMRQTIQAEQCAARANSLMPEILANPSSESLQACTMLCMYNMFSGNVATAATYLSVAYRFVSILGAHVNSLGMLPMNPTVENTFSSNLYLRRVFWHCYMYDKDICLRAGYPPIIDDDHCDLTLPPGYKQIDDFETSKDGSDLIPGDMRLTIIKSKMIRRLYCAKAFRSSNIELLKDIRELDDELEAWRMSIPPQYRPILASTYRIQLGLDWNKPKQVHVVVIHFEYYLLLALIHSASGRCRIRAFDEMDHKASVNSCQALALQASRSTLANLAVVAQAFNSGDFWYFVLYPMSASLTIFCNVLTSPLNPRAEEDLELLRKVPGLIREMYTVSLGPADNIRLRQVQGFLEELLRLGQSAVHKASENDGR